MTLTQIDLPDDAPFVIEWIKFWTPTPKLKLSLSCSSRCSSSVILSDDVLSTSPRSVRAGKMVLARGAIYHAETAHTYASLGYVVDYVVGHVFN